MARNINPAPQFFDGQGEPVKNGQMFYFNSGTNTPLKTFADSLETIPNSHPVLLDSSGRLPNVFFSGTAKQVLVDANGVQLFERDPVGGESLLGDFAPWDPSVIYNLLDIVRGSNERFYISDSNDNIGNDPIQQPSLNWSEIRFLGVFNIVKTYQASDVVQTSSGNLWKSITNNNTGNNPDTDGGVNWEPAIDQALTTNIWDPLTTYVIGSQVRTDDGNNWKSLTNPNTGNDPTTDDGTNWLPAVEGSKIPEVIDFWDPLATYNLGNKVSTPDGNIWKSLIPANLGNDPSVDPGTNWQPAIDDTKLPELIQINNDISDLQANEIPAWQIADTYSIGNIVKTTDGNLWKSLTNSNTGNNPPLDSGTNWVPAISGDKVPEIITLQNDVSTLDSSDITNVSGVTGSTTTAALNTLNNDITNLDSNDIANASGVTGATTSAALNQLDNDISGLGSNDITNQSLVTGATTSAALNQLDSDIDTTNSTIAALGTNDIANQSGVSGVNTSAALNQLNSDIGALNTNDISNSSGVTGATTTAALNTLNNDISTLNSDDIANNSAVTGATTSDALETLGTTLGIAEVPSPTIQAGGVINDLRTGSPNFLPLSSSVTIDGVCAVYVSETLFGAATVSVNANGGDQIRSNLGDAGGYTFPNPGIYYFVNLGAGIWKV